jgi:hypothetical protein
MSYSDIVIVFSYADTTELVIAQSWLAELELAERGARLLENAKRHEAARKSRRESLKGGV